MDTVDLEFRLSGGASNSDPDASIGGIKSSTKMLARSGTLSTITGVTIDDVVGVPTDDVAFRLTGADTIALATEESFFGDFVDVSSDGTYTLFTASGEAEDGYAVITVVAASLNGSTVEEIVTTTRLNNKLFDDISNTEASGGHTDYRCVYLHNEHSTDSLAHVAVFIHENLAEDDSIAIGLDPAGIGDGSTTGVAAEPADEETAPAGVTFSTPNEGAPLLSSGTIDPDDGFAIWIKREIPAGVLYNSTVDAFVLGAKGFVVLP